VNALEDIERLKRMARAVLTAKTRGVLTAKSGDALLRVK
jgi:hypothetical protein